MTKDEFAKLKRDNKVRELKLPDDDERRNQRLVLLDEFLPILNPLRQPITHRTVSSAPAFTPKTWADCFQPFDDGVNRGLHIFINGTWRTITAT